MEAYARRKAIFSNRTIKIKNNIGKKKGDIS